MPKTHPRVENDSRICAKRCRRSSARAGSRTDERRRKVHLAKGFGYLRANELVYVSLTSQEQQVGENHKRRDNVYIHALYARSECRIEICTFDAQSETVCMACHSIHAKANRTLIPVSVHTCVMKTTQAMSSIYVYITFIALHRGLRQLSFTVIITDA
jgi:hypothetical protein